MKNKTIDKQVLSALAIGIGAGILLNPVTARADEGEDNTVGLDDKVEEHTNEVTAEESSEAKDYSEAVQAESEAVKEADNEILNAEAMVNQALEGADEADKSDYQAVIFWEKCYRACCSEINVCLINHNEALRV